jgi:C4-type Zn-finger protein
LEIKVDDAKINWGGKMEERIAKIEGIMEQMNERLNHVEADLKNKADKWEIRIWFLIVVLLMTVYRFFVSSLSPCRV